jgi:hypothetical protein
MITADRARFQFGLRTLLRALGLIALLCALVKFAAPYVPVELGNCMLLSVVVAAVPAAIIGRKIDRMFESMYLGIIWGVAATVVTNADYFLASFLVFFNPPDPWYMATKVAAASLIGGSFGGFVMWRIKVTRRVAGKP